MSNRVKESKVSFPFFLASEFGALEIFMQNDCLPCFSNCKRQKMNHPPIY